MSFKRQTVNKEKITPIPTSHVDISKVKGGCMFNLNKNIFIVAKKNSGKTNIVFHYIKKCTNKNTRFYIFSSTIDSDENWQFATDWLQKRGNQVEVYTSIRENGIDYLEDVINQLKEEARARKIEESRKAIEKQKPKPKPKPSIFDDCCEEEGQKKESKPKKEAPAICFILDDLGDELRVKSVSQLLKTHRHYKSSCILSSQELFDLTPAGRKQLDYLLIGKGMPEDKIRLIYSEMKLSSVNEDTFADLYKDATKEDYTFFYINTRGAEEYRSGLSEKYIINK